MERLVEKIKKVADKYLGRTNLIIAEDNIKLEYFVFNNGKKELYRTLHITELEDKLKVVISPEKIQKVVDIAGLEDILLILDKQSNVKKYTTEEIEQIKVKYQKNTKVRLIKMYDLQAPEPGTIGYVKFVDGIGQIHIRWDNGSGLALTRIDEFEILCPICGNKLDNRPALSRKDNKTNICSQCGALEALEIHLENKDKIKNEQEIKPQIIVHKGLGELKHKEIVDKLMAKCDSASAAIQDIVESYKQDDPKGVEKFFNQINKEVAETEGQDGLLVNDVLFDWKQLNRPEIVGELVDLALNCMSNENSREKLESILNG